MAPGGRQKLQLYKGTEEFLKPLEGEPGGADGAQDGAGGVIKSSTERASLWQQIVKVGKGAKAFMNHDLYLAEAASRCRDLKINVDTIVCVEEDTPKLTGRLLLKFCNRFEWTRSRRQRQVSRERVSRMRNLEGAKRRREARWMGEQRDSSLNLREILGFVESYEGSALYVRAPSEGSGSWGRSLEILNCLSAGKLSRNLLALTDNSHLIYTSFYLP